MNEFWNTAIVFLLVATFGWLAVSTFLISVNEPEDTRYDDPNRK